MALPPRIQDAHEGDSQPYGVSFQDVEQESEGGMLSPLQVWCMLRAHLWLSVAICVPLMALAFVGFKSLPKSYSATATLIVSRDNADPLAGRPGLAGGGFGAETFVASQIALINDNVMLQPVADRLKLLEDKRYTKGKDPDPKADRRLLNDYVLVGLRKSLNVHPGEGNLLYISATARDPSLAADIANAVADEYIRQTSERANAPAKERAERYSAQLAELKKNLEEAQAKFAAFRQENEITTPNAGGDTESAALDDLQRQIRAAQNARRELESKLGSSGAESSKALDEKEVVNLRTKLSQLEGELVAARATYGVRHPKILQLQSEIDATRSALQSGADTALMRARALENNYLAAAEIERKRLLQRRTLQDKGAKLQLELQLAQDNYSQALRGLDQIQFASQGNYKDVTLVNSAEAPVQADASGKRKLFLLSVVAIMGLAVGAPFAYELFLNRRIRCRDDFKRGFRIETLVELGPIKPAANL